MPFAARVQLFYACACLLFINGGIMVRGPRLLLFCGVLYIKVILFPVVRPVRLFFQVGCLFVFFRVLVTTCYFCFAFSRGGHVGVNVHYLNFLILFFCVGGVRNGFLVSSPCGAVCV